MAAMTPRQRTALLGLAVAAALVVIALLALLSSDRQSTTMTADESTSTSSSSSLSSTSLADASSTTSVVAPPAIAPTTSAPADRSTDGAWRPMADAPIGPRGSAVAVWTGSEMIVWAGVDHFTDACAVRPDTDEQFCGDPAIFDGAAYDPATDTWRRIADGPVPADGAPTRTLPVGVWTGTELVVWGGYGEPIAAAYDPVEDRWRDLPPGPLSARELPAIAVLGDEVVVLGGRGVFGERRSHLDAAALDPLTGRWRRLPDLPDSGSAEPGLADAVVDAGRLIVLAGSRNDAYVLEPGSRAWRHLGAPDLPEYTAASLGVAGRHWLVSQCGPERRAAALDLGSFHWEPVAEPPTPCGAAVPLGSQLALVGAPPWRAATWDPGTGQFGALAAPAGPNRCGGTLVSTGTRLLSWSGFPCEETGIYLEADAVAGGSRFDPR